MTNQKEEHNTQIGPSLEDFVYGAIDGTVTTFAVVAGVAGANLAGGIALILGFANLLSDGFSMAASDFLSKRSKKQFMERERKREEHEVENMPGRERSEIREIYKKKGFKGKLLDQVVATIISNKKRWVDVMMREELNLVEDGRGAGKSAIVTFFSFLIIGLTYAMR
ncbi:VIT1/CCC1 transporter family protein [Candidatus Woesearchaeota archaeon]|nr:VIT1/CCC1 transporter family protein [Candidatus Woesearchaeota archaeon]